VQEWREEWREERVHLDGEGRLGFVITLASE